MSVEQRRESDFFRARSPRARPVLRAVAASAVAAALGLAVTALAQDAGLRASDDDFFGAASGGAFYPQPSGLSPEAAAANYGKPRPFRPKPKSNRKTPAHPLPDLVPYPTPATPGASVRRVCAATASIPPCSLPPPTTAMPAPIPAHPKPKPDPDPFAPPGLDAGPLRAHAYSETDFGYNSNPFQAATGTTLLRGSSFVREEVGLSAVSDWSNHSFIGDMRLGYNDFFNFRPPTPLTATASFSPASTPRATPRSISTAITRFRRSTRPRPTYTTTADRPRSLRNRSIAAYGGGLGVSQDFNRVELTLRGSVERNYWEDAHFADGATQDLSRDSYDDYGLTLKASYALTPDVQPFILGGVDQRIHDSSRQQRRLRTQFGRRHDQRRLDLPVQPVAHRLGLGGL